MCTLYQWCKTKLISLSINFTKQPACWYQLVKNDPMFIVVGLDVNVFDVQIPVCKSHKVLGIVINETLDWTAQINNVAKLINYSLFVFKKIKSYLPLKARIAYCNDYVLLHTDYCNNYNIWGGTLNHRNRVTKS